MTEHVFKLSNLADMTEAARLTQAGRLAEATALIQRGFSGSMPAPARPATIDLIATETASASKPVPPGPGSHAAILPEGLRDALGQIVRGLKGGAPSIKGLTGSGLAGLGLGGFRAEKPGPHDESFVERSFSNAAGARDYKLFVPGNRSGKRPLVVMLHGCTQSPDDFAAGTRMNELAEADGLYVAYPRQTRGANAQKCWNWFETRDQGREQGEAGIVAGITRAIIAEHGIDPKRVYIAGLSAGGAAAANIARAYPDLYAGVGVHSGLAAGCARDLSSALMAMRSGAPGAQQPGGASGFGTGSAGRALRVPTIVFHGAIDETVNPRNGEEVLAQAGIDGLSPRRESGAVPGGHAYTLTRYLDSDDRIQVESWRVEGSGHAWSGGSKAGSYTDPRGPDASRAMLDFFARHTLAGG